MRVVEFVAAAICAAAIVCAPSAALASPAESSDPALELPQVERTDAYLTEDEELNRAIDFARLTLPRFVSIYQAREQAPEELVFMIRMAASDGAGGREYRWLERVEIQPDASVSGVLRTEGSPSAAKVGAPADAAPSQIVDWAVFTESGKIVGGYTTRVDVRRADAATQALYEGRFID